MISRILPCLLLSASALLAANSITPGTVTLNATFECIGIVAPYTGDDNGNATFAVQYKPSAGSTWIDSFTPYVDRRSTVGGFSNPNVKQGRVSIVGLTPNTVYNVKTTWTDADGGGGSATNNVTTLTFTPPTGGTTRYVAASASSEGDGTSGNPWKTITNALANCNAGDTILVTNGTYAAFTWTKSGTANAWIIVRAHPGQTPAIAGGAVNQNISLQASYVMLDGFTFNTAQHASIVTSVAAHDVFIQNCGFGTVASAAAGGDSCINVNQRTNIYFLTNTISGGLGVSDTHAIAFGTQVADGIVVKGCTIHGVGWDGLGGGGNYGPGNGQHNCDFYGNNIYDCGDDQIELDGDGINVRAWNNQIHGSAGVATSGFSTAPIHCGPLYVFRNVFSMTNQYCIKNGNNCTGPIYFFHNTFSTVGSSTTGWEATGESGGAPYSILCTFKNNIMEARGNTIWHQNPAFGNIYDYNLHRTTVGTLVGDWNGANYTALSDFQSGTGQEAHGISGNAGIQSYVTGAILVSSPAYNTGVILQNFNTRDGAFGYTGIGPEMGAYEIGGFTTNGVNPPTPPGLPGPPKNLRLLLAF